MTHNALQTLWGSGDPERDQARKNTAKSMISPGVRPQEIYTPQCIIDGLLQLWPEGISLDPCTGPDSIVPARVTCTEAGNGLECVWQPYTYVNPPFKHLKLWLAKAVESAESTKEIVLLCPTRHHRKWFRAALRSADESVYLNPLKFHGYKQAFPAPLCLIYWGTQPGKFATAFEKLGEPL